MATTLMALARRWDDLGVMPPELLSVHEPEAAYAKQLIFPVVPTIQPNQPVNVASIPQLSPFRYPGGKTWLVPTIRAWLLAVRPKRLFEPFAGGAIVSLTAAAENLAEEVVFCEKDPAVAAVWRTVLSPDCEWLVERILSFDLSLETARAELDRTPQSVREFAFQTVLRNRVQRGGIMAPGAGFTKVGEGGKGIRSRWYPETLAKRLRAIHQHRARLHFVQGDAFTVFGDFAQDPDTALYVDPPYVKAARRLYTCWSVDHQRIFELCSNAEGSVLMSYDNTEEVVGWAKQSGLATRPITMKNTHHAKMDELLIGPNLSWFDRSAKVAA
jgi:DNA adenine methylase